MTRTNMYLILKYIVLIILSYKYVYGMQQKAGNHCAFPFSRTMEYFMPVPYRAPTTSAATVIAPGRDGHLSVARGESFQLSCSGDAFVSPPACLGVTEATVECAGGTAVVHGGRPYEFNAFRCGALPRANLSAARAPCHGVAGGLFDVAFDTRVRVPVYRACFDAAAGRTLYAWTYADAPLSHEGETSTTLPRFVDTEHFGSARMADVYGAKDLSKSKTLEDPSMTMGRIMTSTLGHFLIPGHLLIRNQFIYSFQQFATYFYENTAPVWSEFSNGIWKDAERLFLRNLYRYKGKQLIVAGTINSTQLKITSKSYTQNPFIVKWLGNISVPISIWRMIYNVQNKRGIVFIGLNSPFKRGDPKMHFCKKIVCPGRLGQQITATNLVYCCTKESFEKAYGPLDPVVYQEF